MSREVAYPVQVLREHIIALEAALSVCLAEPAHKPVHRLRTETRRVEAQLTLLGLLPGMPEHEEHATALRKELRRLRRAAGEVRDMDVLRRLLEQYLGPDTEAQGDFLPATAPDTDAAAPQPRSERKGKGPKGGRDRTDESGEASETTSSEGSEVRLLHHLAEGAKELRDALGKERDHGAEDLQDLLKKRQTRTAQAAEALLGTLHPAREFALPEVELLNQARATLQRNGNLRKGKIADLSEKQLHSLRKDAKAARYLAEALPESAAAVAVAERFESVQEAGGAWHDLVQLTRAARKQLGRNHELADILAGKRDVRLAVYAEALSQVQREETARAGSLPKTKTTRRRTARGR